jgi:hypothetical protein
MEKGKLSRLSGRSVPSTVRTAQIPCTCMYCSPKVVAGYVCVVGLGRSDMMAKTIVQAHAKFTAASTLRLILRKKADGTRLENTSNNSDFCTED